MLRKSSLKCLFLWVASTVLFPIQSLACACCAEPGTYSIRTSRPDNYTLSVISDLSFEKSADLYMTEAGFDMIKGLDPIKNEYEGESWTASTHFDLVASFTNKVWRFNVKTPGGSSTTLALPMPTQMVAYKVDIHDQEDRPNGPSLYKEFRFKGNLSSASGFAKSGWVRGTSYFLVFQGRGNGCDNASDFTHWRLEIAGPKADYAFFGKLDGEDAAKAEAERE